MHNQQHTPPTGKKLRLFIIILVTLLYTTRKKQKSLFVYYIWQEGFSEVFICLFIIHTLRMRYLENPQFLYLFIIFDKKVFWSISLFVYYTHLMYVLFRKPQFLCLFIIFDKKVFPKYFFVCLLYTPYVCII